MIQSEKLLILWFGSPALLVAGIFFMLYFRPEHFPGLLALGRLALGLGMVVTLFTAGSSLFLNIVQTGYLFESSRDILQLIFLAVAILVDLVFLLLIRRIQPVQREAN